MQPRTWRMDLLDCLDRGPAVRGGCLALVADILEWDDILVTANGNENLTDLVPSDPKEIEALMA